MQLQTQMMLLEMKMLSVLRRRWQVALLGHYSIAATLRIRRVARDPESAQPDNANSCFELHKTCD